MAARELLQCCRAIKSPSIDGYFITLKTFQQLYSNEDLLQEVLKNQNITNNLKILFKGMYDLANFNNPTVIGVKQKAMDNSDDFVLKPLKEGGDNNFFYRK